MFTNRSRYNRLLRNGLVDVSVLLSIDPSRKLKNLASDRSRERIARSPGVSEVRETAIVQTKDEKEFLGVLTILLGVM